MSDGTGGGAGAAWASWTAGPAAIARRTPARSRRGWEKRIACLSAVVGRGLERLDGLLDLRGAVLAGGRVDDHHVVFDDQARRLRDGVAYEVADLVGDAGVLEQEDDDGLAVLGHGGGVAEGRVQPLLVGLGGDRLRRELEPSRALDARLRGLGGDGGGSRVVARAACGERD